MSKQSFVSLAAITLGAFIFALSVTVFTIPNQMGEGGITGISILLQYTLNIDAAVSNLAINTFLIIVGFRFLDRSRIFYTIYTYVMISFFIHMTSGWGIILTDRILAPVATGTMIGTSVGIIMLAGGSTAGTDIIALMLNKYLHIPTSAGLLLIDVLIVTPSAFIIGFEKMIYTFIALTISVRLLDFILLGLNPKKTVMIISEHHAEIAEKITRDISRGVTVLHGEGYYSGLQKRVLYVVMDRRQMLELTKFVTAIDPKAFYTVSNVHSVIGEGFTFHLS